MRLLVVDPRLLVEALVTSDGARRLLVLLAYGRAANLARLYSGADTRVGSKGEVEVGGPSYEDLLVEGEDRLAELAEGLGPDAPDDLALVLSSDLLEDLDDALEKLHERKIAAGLDRATMRSMVLAHTSVLLDSDTTPRYEWRNFSGRRPVIATRPRPLDVAAEAHAYGVISEDESLALDREVPVRFESSTGQEVMVLTLAVFAARHLRGFDLGRVPMRLSSVPMRAP